MSFFREIDGINFLMEHRYRLKSKHPQRRNEISITLPLILINKNMPEKLLYYLGAGASAFALPISKSIKDEKTSQILVQGLADELINIDFDYLSSRLKDHDLAKKVVDLKGRFEDLALKANLFGDVDTYAKYLNLMSPGGHEIKELKQTISQFFAIKQLILNARDKRYLPWLVGIMQRKIFPENVKILSWNYDYQVQFASGQIGSFEDVKHENNSFTYSPSMLPYYPNIDPTFSDFHQLSLIHLNGIAGIAKMEWPKTGSAFQKSNINDYDSIFRFIINNDLNSSLHFAWENSGYHNKLMNHVKNMIYDTTIMVIIGYSFPFFNREFDKQIMTMLKGQNKFPKIYYQDPILDGKQLITQFGFKSNYEIVPIRNIDRFHIPFEY